MCRLLSTLTENNGLAFPVHLHKQERPDFVLRSGSKTIGIEVTEAIPRDYARAVALRKELGAEGVIELSHFKWGLKTKSKEELEQIVSQNELTGDGWEGDEPEREWAEAIRDIVGSKHNNLSSAGFELFSINWLLVYDNLPLPPKLDPDLCTDYLSINLQSYWHISSRFDSIFIESGDKIFRLTRSRSTPWSLNDLWSRS